MKEFKEYTVPTERKRQFKDFLSERSAELKKKGIINLLTIDIPEIPRQVKTTDEKSKNKEETHFDVKISYTQGDKVVFKGIIIVGCDEFLSPEKIVRIFVDEEMAILEKFKNDTRKALSLENLFADLGDSRKQEHSGNVKKFPKHKKS